MGKRGREARSSSTAGKVKGKAKEMAGKITGDERMQGDGKAEHAMGRAKEAMEEAKERVAGAKDAVSRKAKRER